MLISNEMINRRDIFSRVEQQVRIGSPEMTRISSYYSWNSAERCVIDWLLIILSRRFLSMRLFTRLTRRRILTAMYVSKKLI